MSANYVKKELAFVVDLYQKGLLARRNVSDGFDGLKDDETVCSLQLYFVGLDWIQLTAVTFSKTLRNRVWSTVHLFLCSSTSMYLSTTHHHIGV